MKLYWADSPDAERWHGVESEAEAIEAGRALGMDFHGAAIWIAPVDVAIEHLEIGTRGDNRRDSIERGRAVVMIRQTELEKLRAEIGRLRHRLESRGRLLRYWRSKARGSIGRRAVETDAPAVAVSSRGATRAASNAEPAALAGRAPNAALGPGQPTAAPAAC